ncbi:MAG: hypothetical protein HZA88_09105 [Verrucomicrobia bacterium]|nr:hypothetical protein [Verrucomicrobiota bacterium]
MSRRNYSRVAAADAASDEGHQWIPFVVKRLGTVLLAAFCGASFTFAVETVTVCVQHNDGKTEQTLQKLEKVGDNIYRLKIPIKAISRDVSCIDVLYDDATARKGEDGYFVMGDGRLGTFRLDKGRIEERRNPMPLFGMKNSKGAFVGIVKGLKYEFSTIVEAKNGEYRIWPRFLIKEMAFVPYEDIVIDFHHFDGDKANYCSMARAYRDYQLARSEVVPLRERVKGNPQLAYTADAMFIRVKHGIKVNKDKIEHQTRENEPPVTVFHTFDDFMRIMKELKELGVEKAEMCSVGWNSGGFDGRFPQLFPVEEKFGGEAKMREAIALAHRLGYQIVCHVCNTDFYTVADRYNEGDIAKRADGSLHKHGVLAGGRAYFPCFKCVYERHIDGDYKHMADMGLKGTHHIDVTSCIVPYPCHDPKHPCNRQQTADYMNAIGEKARKVFGGFGSEGPCDHVARTLDYALYVTAYPKWVGRDTPMMDRIVPLWQIVYHGIILSNPFYATIDYPFERATPKKNIQPYQALNDARTRRLKVAEFGGRPTFYFIDYKNLKPIKQAYDEYQPIKYLQYEFMDYHGSIGDNVFVTRYSDGSEVVTNYSDKDFSCKGRVIKPMDYQLFKPGAR